MKINKKISTKQKVQPKNRWIILMYIIIPLLVILFSRSFDTKTITPVQNHIHDHESKKPELNLNAPNILNNSK